jgi:hypothetical protein
VAAAAAGAAPLSAAGTVHDGAGQLRLVLSPPGSFGIDASAAAWGTAELRAALSLRGLGAALNAMPGLRAEVERYASTAAAPGAPAAATAGGQGASTAVALPPGVGTLPPGVGALPPGVGVSPLVGATAELVFLGTGCATPSKYRNVSSVYLSVGSGRGMLIDAGEGCYGQLVRRLGPSGAVAALVGLRCVWVSHMHADHHLGLIELLTRRHAALADRATAANIRAGGVAAAPRWPWWPWASEDAPLPVPPTGAADAVGAEGTPAEAVTPLLVLGPRFLHDWLQQYAGIEASAGSYRFVDNAAFTPDCHRYRNQPYRYHQFAAVRDQTLVELRAELGLSLRCVEVFHPGCAYALVLEAPGALCSSRSVFDSIVRAWTHRRGGRGGGGGRCAALETGVLR